MLKGYKTYIASGIFFLLGLYMMATEGTITIEAIESIMAALGLFGLRNAIQ